MYHNNSLIIVKNVFTRHNNIALLYYNIVLIYFEPQVREKKDATTIQISLMIYL